MAASAGLYNAAIQTGTKAIGTAFGAAARHLSKEGQAEDRQAEADLDALKRNEFGPTRSQQERMVNDAVSLARQQAQAQRAEAARQRAASGYVMGAQAGQDAKIAQTAENTAGATRLAVSDAATRQAAQAKRDALARITARAAKTEQDVAGVFDTAQDAYANSGGINPEGMDATTLRDAYNKKNVAGG